MGPNGTEGRPRCGGVETPPTVDIGSCRDRKAQLQHESCVPDRAVKSIPALSRDRPPSPHLDRYWAESYRSVGTSTLGTLVESTLGPTPGIPSFSEQVPAGVDRELANEKSPPIPPAQGNGLGRDGSRQAGKSYKIAATSSSQKKHRPLPSKAQ